MWEVNEVFRGEFKAEEGRGAGEESGIEGTRMRGEAGGRVAERGEGRRESGEGERGGPRRARGREKGRGHMVRGEKKVRGGGEIG